MATYKTVVNVTTGVTVKLKKALKSIENCSCAWVEEGVSIRTLNLQENLLARNAQAARRTYLSEPLASAELPGLRYVPPMRNDATSNSRGLIRAARWFAEGCAA